MKKRRVFGRSSRPRGTIYRAVMTAMKAFITLVELVQLSLCFFDPCHPHSILRTHTFKQRLILLSSQRSNTEVCKIYNFHKLLFSDSEEKKKSGLSCLYFLFYSSPVYLSSVNLTKLSTADVPYSRAHLDCSLMLQMPVTPGLHT